MKTIKLIALGALLALAGKAHADNVTVSDVTMAAGETKEVAIELVNPDAEYSAFQFNLVLPEGFSIAKNNKGKYIYRLNDERIDDQTLTVTEISSGNYRFLSFSLTNASLYGESGALVYVTLAADESVSSGTKQASVTSQVFTTSAGVQSKLSDATFQITVPGEIPPSYLKGDMNDDGVIDITDVVILVNTILNQ